MRIGIDARLYGLEHAGLGRYVLKLVETVLKADTKNKYVLFLTKNHAEEFKNRQRVKVVVCNIPIYSLAEQLLLPWIFQREKLDLLHIPHFNAPLLYLGRYVLTIHDLIKHDSTGMATTTRQPLLYLIKRLGYLFLTSLIAKRAQAILVPSNFVKDDVAKRLKVSRDKITVTYEAVSGSLRPKSLSAADKKTLLARFGLTQPFIVYTGSLYPHKNVDLLIEAVARHNRLREVDLELVLICSRSVFWKRTNQKIIIQKLDRWVKMLGFVEDEDVSKLYSLALALVHPSRMEGFGLTGLEAMAVGLPVIASNTSCLPEVYSEAAMFFNPDSLSELVGCLDRIIADSHLREELITNGFRQAKKYSWEKMARKTIAVYQQAQK
jgi:glycosyltransferase involved in cell wall biosynthesis